AGLKHGGIGCHVGLGAGVRLDVGVLGAEELLGAVARQVLDHVRKLAAAVVALGGITLRILVGENRAHGFQHGFADEVFRSDKFEAFVLAAGFVVDGEGYVGINLVERAGHGVLHGAISGSGEL